MALDITRVLNDWAAQGVFSYLFPFLIIFSLVFAILQKTRIFEPAGSNGNSRNVNGINAIIAISVAFLALLNDYVSTFFASLFPRFGIALAILLVLLILVGIFVPTFGSQDGKNSWVGWSLAVVVVIWAWSEWKYMFGSGWGLNSFLEEYFWGLVLLAGLGGLIYWIVKSDDSSGTSSSRSTPTV